MYNKTRTLVGILFMAANTALALTGTGTEIDPYRIRSLADFDDFVANAEYWDGHVNLETDVDLSGRVYTTAVIAPDVDSGTDWFQGPRFAGVFDGNGHHILNLTIDAEGLPNSYLGLFGCLDTGAMITRCHVANVSVRGGHDSVRLECFAGLVGMNWGTITDCSVSGEISGRRGCNVGGLVGFNGKTISNCHMSGSVTGLDMGSVAGLVGSNQGSTTGFIRDCHAEVNVSGYGYAFGGLVGSHYSKGTLKNCTVTGRLALTAKTYYVGGLVGESSESSIEECCAVANITAKVADQSNRIGGLVGDSVNGTLIKNCYSVGEIIGGLDTDRIGGLVGLNGGNSYNSKISRILSCYSAVCLTDMETSTATGALVGVNLENGVVEDSYWDADKSGVAVSDGGLGRSSGEMARASTFSDWDFGNTWDMGENQTYPYLRTYSAADLNKDRTVNLLDLSIMAEQWGKP